MGKNECLERASEARQKISTIGPMSHRGSNVTMCRECVQEAGRQSAENFHAEECRSMSWNRYQDYRPQSCQGSSPCQRQLGEKGKEEDEEKQGQEPMS
jgi:hypothetical protein